MVNVKKAHLPGFRLPFCEFGASLQQLSLYSLYLNHSKTLDSTLGEPFPLPPDNHGRKSKSNAFTRSVFLFVSQVSDHAGSGDFSASRTGNNEEQKQVCSLQRLCSDMAPEGTDTINVFTRK